jgi:iron complex transport system ATP-binding protein
VVNILEVKNLSFSYGRPGRLFRPVLEGVNLSLRSGELLCLLGPNGSGKSTMFRCILGLEKYNGEIFVNGTDLTDLSPPELAKKVAYVPQTNYPSFNYSVFEMTLMGTAAQGREWSLPGPTQKKAAADALELVGISELRNRGFRDLSGGEQQLCLIARAIAQQAELFIMDEPTANLDYGNQLRILKHIKELCGQGRSILMSTHNPEHAFIFANRVAALHRRTIITAGPPGKIITAELIENLYGIGVTVHKSSAGKISLSPALE